MTRSLILFAALIALAGCGREWLDWRVPARAIETDPVELVCHETPHAFGGPPALSCVEV